MRRLAITSTAALLAFLVYASPAWAEWVWPLRGEVITPYRNGGDPYAAGQHRGIDIAGEPGAPVVAAAEGVVRFAGPAGSSGLTVSVRTADGRYDSSYLHLSAVSVSEGEHVAAGARLGAVGTTGKRSVERPHLHFGVRDAGSRHGYRDPLALLPPPPGPQTEPPGEISFPRPLPVEPAPAPSPTGAPRQAPVPRGQPGRVPRPAPVPTLDRSPHGEPARAPDPASRRGPVPAHPVVPIAGPHGAPDGSRSAWGTRRTLAGSGAASPSSAPRPRAGFDGHRQPADALDLARGQAPGAAPAPTEASRAPIPGDGRPVPSAPGDGPDLGWILACAGLVLAAGILLFSGSGRKHGKHDDPAAGRVAAKTGARRAGQESAEPGERPSKRGERPSRLAALLRPLTR